MSVKIQGCFLLCLLILGTAGCKNKGKAQKMEEKFDWTGTVSAPEEYPMEVYEGAIIASDFTFHFDEMWSTVNTGWGETGGAFSIDRDQMDAPDSLKFTWMSIVEKKFYTGSWKLDKEKIARLFSEGYINYRTNIKSTYNQIKVGLAPKGLIVVWLTGAGFQTEVGAFQAAETTITKDEAYENSKYMFDDDFVARILADKNVIKPEIKRKIESQGYPDPAIYQLYRNRYVWRPEIHVPQDGKVTQVYYDYFNGEEDTRFGQDLIDNAYLSRTVPKNLIVFWTGKTRHNNALSIEPFEEKEVLEAFRKLGNAENIDLVITLNEANTGAEVSLKNTKETIKIISAKIKISENLTD